MIADLSKIAGEKVGYKLLEPASNTKTPSRRMEAVTLGEFVEPYLEMHQSIRDLQAALRREKMVREKDPYPDMATRSGPLFLEGLARAAHHTLCIYRALEILEKHYQN